MRIVKILLILAAFLIMISSVLTMSQTTDRTSIYINLGAMAALVAAVTYMNFKNPEKRNR